MYIFCVDVYFSWIDILEVQLLTGMITLCLIIFEEIRLFSKIAIPFYIPISNERGLQCLYILANSCYYLSFFLIAILVGVVWHLLVILIVISSMAYDGEQFFTHVFSFWR
jgi:hypothetical protein